MDPVDTITRCHDCKKLVGATWEPRGWRTYKHDMPFRQRVPHVLPCDGGGRLAGR